MTTTMQQMWDQYIFDHLELENEVKLRKGSNFKKAAPWVMGISAPSMPTKMLSNVYVYESWINPANLKIAKENVLADEKITIRDLALIMLEKTHSGTTAMPYLWWVWPHSAKKRAIHEDANGLTFVKLDGKWQLVYSAQAMGILAGAQGADNYEKLPTNCYFVSWENEDIAKSHL